jgi:uncharacterized protein
MAKRNDGILGAPCWMDLSTSDRGRATAFYSALFGWDAYDTGADYGHYTLFGKGDAGIAGMMQGQEGMPDAWTVYFAVADAEKTLAAAKSAGGEILSDAMVVGDRGTLGVLADPSGAAVGVWQPDQLNGFQLYGEVGAPCWHELMTNDFAAATEFYAKVLPVTAEAMEMGDGPEYKTLNVDGESHAGIFDAATMLPEGVPSYWSVYYGVEDTDAAVEKVEELGGSVVMPVQDSPFGRWAIVTDPMGASFAIVAV